MGMTLTQFRADLRLQLKDSGALWSDGEIDSCVQRATADMSRFIPRQQVYETQLTFTVSAEAWTSAAAAGTYVTLANKPIKYQSETVLDDASATMVRDTDYYIDYMNGKITHISGGDIGNEEVCSISYTKSEIAIDLSSLTTLIRIAKVFYPTGWVPQADDVGWELWDDVLWIRNTTDSQSHMSAGQHIAIWYLAEHTAALVSTAGTTPSVLDWSLIVSACAYACFVKAAEYGHQAIADIATVSTYVGDANSVLDLISATGTPATALSDVNVALDAAVAELVKCNAALDKIDNAPGPNLTDADTALDAALGVTALGAVDGALDKVATYLENNTNEDSKAWLTKITTDIAGLRTAVLTALDAANTYLDEVDTTDLQGAEAVWADEEMHIRENIVQGTATSTSSFTVTDTGASFTTADVGKLLYNRTDDTWSVVVAYTSGTVLELSHDIVASGEEYAVMFPQGAALLGFSIADINKITVGKDVPERFVATVQASLATAQLWSDKRKDFIALAQQRSGAALGFVSEAQTRLANLASYLEQAAGWGAIAQGFIGEAGGRIGLANGYATEAQGRLAIAQTWVAEAVQRIQSASAYIGEAQGRVAYCRVLTEEAAGRLSMAATIQQTVYMDLQIAAQWRDEGIDRRNEAWAIWADPKNYVGQFVLQSVRQPASIPR